MKFRIFRPLLSIGLAAMLLFSPASIAAAAGEGADSGSAAALGKAGVKGKDEVIYAVLAADGSVSSLYAVNHFTIDEAGSIMDYGDYTSVLNLTDTAPMAYRGDAVSVQTDSENFYYQGEMAQTALPWLFDISYALDGVKTAPQELAGKSGRLEIHIATRQNAAVNPAFYENYMLQISVTLDTEKCGDIEAPGAVVAGAGKNKVIVFTVMPGSDAELSLGAVVSDFSMAGIDISAMPFSMDMEFLNIDKVTDGFDRLSGAISALNDGVGSLAAGAAELKAGADNLTNGSSDIKTGLAALSGNSGQLIQASSQIGGALAQIASSLNGAGGELSLGDLTQLPRGLSQMAGGLNEIADGLAALKTGFASAYGALDGAIQGIPAAAVGQEQLAALYAQTDSSQHGLLDQLVASYTAAQTVKGAYSQVKGAFDAVGPAIDTLSASIGAISAALDETSKKIEGALSGMDMIQQLAQLSAGLSELSRNYAAFHSGLQEYLGGIEALSSGYAGFHSGLSSFGNGVSGLYGGVSELHRGSSRLRDETANMPAAVQSEIDQMLNQYTGSDFEPVSFISPKNQQVDLVQFVLKCEGIEKPAQGRAAEAEASPETVWDRLTSLFTVKKQD